MKHKIKKNKKDNTIPAYKFFFAVVISGFVLFYPWITYLKIWSLDENEQRVFENYSGYVFDFFLHSKSVMVFILAVFLILVLVGENLFPDRILTDTPIRNKYNRWLYCCMTIFVLSVVFSFCFSQNEVVAFHGSYAGGEGILTLLSYPVICLGAMNYFCYDRSLKIFKRIMILLSVLTILLTLVEFFYQPLLNLPFMKYITAPEEYRGIVESMNNSNYRNSVALTFYNPNYYGGFCMLLFPFGISGYFRAKDKNKAARYLFLSIGVFFCVMAAKSSASFYLLLLELVLLSLLERKHWSKSLIKMLVWLGVLAIALVAANFVTNGKLWEIGKNVLTNESSANQKKEIFYLTDIKIDNDTLTLYGEEEALKVCFKNEELVFYDTKNQVLEYKTKERTRKERIIEERKEEMTEETSLFEDAEYPIKEIISFEDTRYQMISGVYQEGYLTFDLGYDDVVDFYIEEGRFWGIGQAGERLQNMCLDSDKRFLEGVYPLFTGRGYAWVNSLSLLPQTALIGKGPGNFTYYFPQNDYVGLLNTHGSHKFIIDKPHNMYLQIWIELGGVACLAVIVFFFLITGRYCRFCAEERKKAMKDVGTAIVAGTADVIHWLFVSVTAFACYAVINDSIVTVTPFVCVLFGVLLSALPIPEVKAEKKRKQKTR